MQSRLVAHWRVLQGTERRPAREPVVTTATRPERPTVAPGAPIGALGDGVTCAAPGFWFGGR